MRVTPSTMGKSTPVEMIGGVFPRRQISIIASEPGCGKTWVMLRFCADVSFSGEWGKFFGCSWVEPNRKCLMFVGDSGKEMIVSRCNQLGIKDVALDENFVLYFVEDFQREKIPFLLNEKDGLRSIERIIREEHPDIVFFDTLISFMTADENSAKEVAEIFCDLRGIAETENCAIVLNHHFRKRGKGDSTKTLATLSDVIGSSAIARLSAVMLGMAKLPDEGNGRKIINVFTVKSWYKEIPQFTFELFSKNESVFVKGRYIAGNTKRAYSILVEFSKQVNSGMILTIETLSEATSIPIDMLRVVLKHHPAYTPLTDEPECDRFIVHQEYKKE